MLQRLLQRSSFCGQYLTKTSIFVSSRRKMSTSNNAVQSETAHKRTCNSEQEAKRIIWIDCEMTGLDLSKHHLVEIAVVVTEGDRALTQLGQGLNLVIHQPAHVLQQMDPWCSNTFTKNGLLDKIKQSTCSVESAERLVLDQVRKYTSAKQCPLAGNSVSVDRLFVNKYMRELGAHLHYRTIDVSTFKECARRWYPNAFDGLPPKKLSHRALDDILESIAELRWYQQNMLRSDLT